MSLIANHSTLIASSDQAASLRRMIGQHHKRSVAIVGGSSTGITSLSINLASALAITGSQTLLIDENQGENSAIARLQLRRRFVFEHALTRVTRLHELTLKAPAGLAVMPFFIPAHLLNDVPISRQQQLAEEFDGLTHGLDWIIIDAYPISHEKASGLALVADEVIVAISPSNTSITDAYATIKRLHLDFGRRQFWILANRARTLEAAQALFARVGEVAKRYLHVKIRLMGFVPEDDYLARANHLGQAVLNAFPQAEASIACKQLSSVMLKWPFSADSIDRANLLYRVIDVSRRLTATK